MFVDYHVHTWFSDDSDYVPEQVVKDAIALGLEEICITDHVDYGVKGDWPQSAEIYDGSLKKGLPEMNVDYPAWHREIRRLQKEFEGRIVIREGMEFGMQTHTIPLYEKLFSEYPFDFIILSCHQVDDKEFWRQDFQRGKTQDEYNLRYYEEILNVIRRYRDYSVIGHLDSIARYDEAGPYPFEKIRDVVAEILRTVIRDGKGIEVNTSSHRYGLRDLTPSRDILRLYRDLGGRVLTIGSDAHEASHLGAYIREDTEELRKLGFDVACTFRQMEPVFHRL